MLQYAPYAVFLAAVAAIVLMEGRRVPAWKLAAHTLLVASVTAFSVLTQGRPRPLWTQQGADEIEIIAAEYHPGAAIYIWAKGDPPVAYELPWRVEMAREMQKAIEESGGAILVAREDRMDGGGGDEARANGGENGEWDGGYFGREYAVHPLPVKKDPPKQPEGAS